MNVTDGTCVQKSTTVHSIELQNSQWQNKLLKIINIFACISAVPQFVH